ncbi:related to TRS130 - subunit of the TRAPP complex of the cis-Golgi [Ustilago trichophora]|uniref:Related to TRS130 - subunit of the TRAPP complex of the cis-Golgi n=1 Tax=Ustilago trichophora TaxID=86804 RepID=A0A5C3ERV1_9BASI|nr:related to TRS130 - subunit of the TRAPP complex of the cis-Golgi [Ustilago trichophora]
MAEHHPSSAERITVTYAASQALLAAPLTPHFINLLKEQLPLRNLHWRPSQSTLDAVAARAAQQGKSTNTSSSVVPGSTIRTIQTLDVALKPLTDEIRRWRGDPGYFDQPRAAGLLDRPFVHLYLVVCEDSEHYRTTVRNEIRSWISSLSFFHAKQAAPPSSSASVGTPTLASSSRTSLGLGSFRSGTPPVRSETPPTAVAAATGTSSGPNTPTNQGVAPKSTGASLPTGPTEPEYLIVLITPPEGAGITGLAGPGAASAEAKTAMGRFMNKSKGNVLEKARADFNTSKKEHVVQLSRLPPVPAVPLGRSGLHSMDPTIWAELLTKMREAASSTFTTTIEAQEEEITRCGITRGQQGWDFCSYFLSKDSLARTLEAVGLKDDAVGQYEDLEIVFAQAMQNGAVSFARVGGDDANDDSLPLLDVTKKPYADLIRKKEISLFDFRCYLFARKSALLGKMGRVAAVMREAPLFISAVGRMLRRNKRLSSQWIESWIFSAALDVVEQCQAWLIQRGGQTSTSTDDQLSPAFHSNKSELLDVARRQLDRIGIEAGHLPATEPFSFATVSTTERDLPPLPSGEAQLVAGLGAAVVLDEKRSSSRPEIQRAVESREVFDSHYLALCDRILTGWKASSRERDALHVRTIVATLHYLRGKHQSAYESLVGLTEAYGVAKFGSLEGHSLAMQLECHAKLDKPKDRAWITAALSALRVSVQSPTNGRRSVEPTQAAKWTDANYLCDQLRTASFALEREIPISGYPLFSITVPDTCAKLAGTEDGSLLTVHVTSSLPCVQEVEDVRACLVTAGGTTLWYTSARTQLHAGVTVVELFCPHPAHGVYSVDVTQIRIARMIFQYDYASKGAEAVLVRVPKDGDAPSVGVALPKEIDLEQKREVEVTIWSGRDDMDVVEVAILSSSDVGSASLVDCGQAKISAGGSAKLDKDQSSAGALVLKSLSKHTATSITLPLVQLPESGILEGQIILTYTTVSATTRYASGRKRTLRTPLHLGTALPLGVNVQDFFRTSCLLSKFTISAGGGVSIRLRPVSLVAEQENGAGEEAGGYTIASCTSEREAMVTPRQPATYLFRISKTDGSSKREDGAKRLRLVVRYRVLQEDAVACAGRAMDAVIEEKGEGLQGLEKGSVGRRLLDDALMRYVRDRLDLPAYSISGQIRTGKLDSAWWRQELRSWGQCSLDLPALLSLISTTLNSILLTTTDATAEEVWQTLTIPVEIPTVDYVNAVTLTLPEQASSVTNGGVVVVGQPVQISISIRTTCRWSTCASSLAEKEGEGGIMVYDIVPDFEMWLVDGMKRGTFVGEEGGSFEVTLKVVPLRTGCLSLPNVLVRTLSSVISTGERRGKVESCETYTTNAGMRIHVIPAKSTKAFFIPTTTTPTIPSGYRSNPSAPGERSSWKSIRVSEPPTATGLNRLKSTWTSQQYTQTG